MSKEIGSDSAAIVSTDVVGYSRLMGEDEEGTLTTLRGHRADLIDPKISEHHGRIVKTMGDGLLIEFPSVVEAVKCAVELQQGMAARNADIAEASRIEFRIGINLGDILIEDDDIHGDGVNVAARLQELAAPGGICLSRAARDQVRDRMDVRLDDRGEIAVKNIARPVHVFQVLNDSDAAQAPAASTHATRKPKRLAAMLVVVLALAGGGAVAWMQPWKAAPAFEPRGASARPSIAVLPFSNLSQDAEQEYFSDGITNDLITDLSKFTELLVIASNSVFTYKGKPVKVQEVGRDLGVRYVLEGSVQKMGERVRINAQLIDARTDQHLWAERYDGGVADLFELQDQITERVVRTLSVRLTSIERERAFKKQTDDLDAYDYVLRRSGLLRRFKRTENFEARQLFRQAIDRDPDYAGAYAGLGNTHLQAVKYGWTGSIKAELKRAEHLARRALAIDDTNVRAHRLLGEIYLFWADTISPCSSWNGRLRLIRMTRRATRYKGLFCFGRVIPRGPSSFSRQHCATTRYWTRADWRIWVWLITSKFATMTRSGCWNVVRGETRISCTAISYLPRFTVRWAEKMTRRARF